MKMSVIPEWVMPDFSFDFTGITLSVSLQIQCGGVQRPDGQTSHLHPKIDTDCMLDCHCM